MQNKQVMYEKKGRHTMVKMIVTDVDGTIVGKDEVLHDEMVAYVKQLKEKQIDYTIATGRCAGLVKDYVER